MLKALSRMERTRSLIIVGFAVLMAVSLVIFYAPGRTARTLDPSRSTEVVAKVGGDDITVGDLTRLKESYMQMFGGQMDIARLGGDRRLLDGLIHDRVIAQEAARLGLAVSDAEVADALRKQVADASGNIDMDRYREMAVARAGSIDNFERSFRDSLAARKLQAFITAGVNVSEDEVREQYKRDKTDFNLLYVVVAADQLAKKIQLSDQELRDYYQQHQTDFRYLTPQKKIRYIFIDQQKAGSKLQISDDELHQEFNNLTGEARSAGVKVQQIVLKVARPDLDAQVKAKADELAQKASNASEEAFADLARGNSEDVATARGGGYLAKPFKKNPNKLDTLYDRVADMQPGEVSITIKYAGTYYILRRGEEVPKTFEEAKNDLRVSAQNRRSYAVAQRLAARAEELLKQSHDAQAVAQQLAAEANMTPAEMVRETGYIKPGDDVPEIGSNQQFEAAIDPLNNPNDVGERTGIKNGFAIPMLVDKKEPRIPEFDEVRAQVEDALRKERAKTQVDQVARDLAANTASAGELKAAAERLGLTAEESNQYKLGAPLGRAGTSPAMDEAIFNLQDGGVTKTPIKVGDSWIIIGLTKRDDADMAAFATQRDTLMKEALNQRRQQVFDDYITNVQAGMQRDGHIKIYDDVLAQLSEDEEAPAAAPQPQRPRLPIPTK
ncbi:MAG TPA: SurA N-terminal domain-containing protein [Pyrinomonadaceae bacterium]|nr:SurA N-terminal domain-containing protein [Pyrinomonadaceae bacterium]